MSGKYCLLLTAGVLCLLLSVSGCSKPSSSDMDSVADSSGEQSSEEQSGDTSSELAEIPTPQLEESEITADPVITAEAKTFTVDKALRAKYYDYFAPSYFRVIPRRDFVSVADITDDDKVVFAIKCTEPIAYTPESGLAIYYYEDIQYTSLKYLGVQIQDLRNSTTYTFDPGNYYFIDSYRYGAFYYFYRLEALSVDAQGVYTGKFTVYQKLFASEEDYRADMETSRNGILAEKVDTGAYTEFSTVTLQFVEMKEPDGTVYYRYVSLKTETVS